MIYVLANNQDKTKENHNSDVYQIIKKNRHKKKKRRVIKVRKK